MAIRFNCPNCRQPIEVDDEIGGRSAACPYCRRVVSVPAESNYTEEAVDAAPAAPLREATADSGVSSVEGPAARSQPPPPPIDLHVGPPPDARRRTAATYGNYALISTSIAVVLMIIYMATVMPIIMPLVSGDTTSQPTAQQLQEAVLQSGKIGIIFGTRVGAAFFSLFGLVFGIASLRNSRGFTNWRAVLALVVSGLFLACACFDVVVSLSGIGG